MSLALNPRAKAQGFSARFVCLSGTPIKGMMYTIRLQVIHNRKVKRYATREACTMDQWDAEAGRVRPRVNGAAQINATLNAIETEVKEIVDSLVVHEALSLDNFNRRYTKPTGTKDILSYMAEIEKGLVEQGRIGYAGTYRTAASALRRANCGRTLTFAQVTPAKLEEMDQFLRKEGCSAGGVAAYMRTIRATVNKAIKDGLMASDKYPFETNTQRGYAAKTPRNKKTGRALNAVDLAKVKDFPFDQHPDLADSVRYFLFSFYADGMNFQDIALLKRSSLRDGRLFYARKKTGREINIPVDDTLTAILDAFKEHKGPYLFPILGPEHVTEMQQWNRIRKCIKKVNDDLKRIAEVLGIEAHLTTYVARHSSFTSMYRAGVPINHISEIARHSSPNVTSLYLRDHGYDVLDEARKKLRE